MSFFSGLALLVLGILEHNGIIFDTQVIVMMVVGSILALFSVIRKKAGLFLVGLVSLVVGILAFNGIVTETVAFIVVIATGSILIIRGIIRFFSVGPGVQSGDGGNDASDWADLRDGGWLD